MKRKLFVMVQVFLASMMTTVIAQSFNSDKVYTIVCKPDFNTFMQDYGTGTLLLGAEPRATLWTFEPTGNPDCYYVKNVVTGNYIQACPDSEVAATMGANPVEYYIKGDATGGQAGENFFRMTSTNRTPYDFTAGTIGLNRAGDNTKVQGFASVAGANQWSVWRILEVPMVQTSSLESPYTGIEVGEGTVYLYNVESGMWLQNNNRANPELTANYWTTRAELGNNGLDFDLTALPDGGYQINPKYGNKHSINATNLYLDTSADVTAWNIYPKEVTGVSNAYTIECERSVLGADVNNYLRGADLGATTWQLVTREERIQYAQDNASASNPIDVTFLVNNPDLSNNNERPAWVVTRDGGTEVWNDFSRYNRHCQVQGSANVDISQTGIEVPNGIYQVRFTTFYAPTGLGNLNVDDYNAYKTNGDEAVFAVAYANEETIKVPSVFSEEATSSLAGVHVKQVGDYYFPGNPDQANGSFAIGNYQSELLTVTVTDGTLTLGIKTIEGCPSSAWIGLSNVKLYYIGAASAENTIDVTITDAGYATFVAPGYIDELTEGVEAYAVQLCEGYVHLEPVTAIPAGEAVVLKATAGTYTLYPKEPGEEIALVNDLKAATEEMTADGTQYILAKDEDGVGFYKATPNTTIAAGKGYLVIAAGVKAFYPFANDATGINAIDNGELTIDNDAIYNLAGQRISKLQKGINIVNGRKIMK
ncbi:MAG: hypothetical protein J6W52_04585 [Bacteroidaceae bacterium]|nr:hypothetical protein [Bacteroidaceae bacterium]